jgi:osmotically-inducible protein OsmY
MLSLQSAWVVHAAPVIGDETIAFWVHRALLEDPRIEAANISVNTSAGIVTLAGSVRNMIAKRYADLEAKKIAGVRGVVNALFVTPSFRFDADITQDVRKRLMNDAAITSEGMRVTVHQGIVTLAGTVTSWAERQEAELLAGEVRGVTNVINQLVVQYPHGRSDAEIQHDVATALARDVYLTGLPLDASVKDGVVTLQGEVGTVYQQERAGDDARLIWNVIGVNNNLTLARGESRGTRQQSPTLTDDQLTAAVHDTLVVDQRLTSSDVTVRVQHGAVTLHGLVPSYYQQRLAAQTARDVVGVTGVTDRLAVRTAPRDDADLQADVAWQLHTDALLAPGSLHVRCHNGIVTLTGDVNNAFEKRHATEVTARVPGLRDLVNNITVSLHWDTDAAIAQRIQDFLAANAETQWVAHQIRVAINQGVVTLTGTVNFWSERDAAGEVAFETEGVRRVDNQLAVASTESVQ